MTGHDPFFDVYDDRFFLSHASEPHFSETKLVGRAIMAAFLPGSVVDLGCGVGAMLAGVGELALELGLHTRRLGVESPSGIERMKRAGAMGLPEGLYFPLDLREAPTAAAVSAVLEAADVARFDVAISDEVAEHLPPECANWHVDLLCALSDTVVMSAAYPGQGGDQHVNERPWTYWRGLLGVRGYAYDEGKTLALIGLFKDKMTRAWGYGKNLRVYRNRG